MSSQRMRRSPTNSARGSPIVAGSTCAECRRLKIRCDRKVPCEQCKRRGCASICPEGQLVPAHANGNNRVIGQVPANIDAIYQKLSSFQQRITELEEALQNTHGLVSEDVHPLLAPDLVRLTKEEEDPSNDKASDAGHHQDEEMMTLSRGSIVKGPSDSSRYFGPGASTCALLTPVSVAALTVVQSPVLSAFAFLAPSSSTASRPQLEAHLPPQDTLRQMINSYFKYSLSLFQPLTPALVTDLCITPPVDSLTSPRLALLFAILALSAQQDPNPPSDWLDATTYYTLSNAALSLADPQASMVIETVECLGIQSLFLLRLDESIPSERAWTVLGLAIRSAQAVHRDCKHWGFDDATIQRRRRTFYELWTFDIVLSSALGRPPTLNRFQVDCEMPIDDAVSMGQNPAFYRWKHQLWTTTVLEIGTSVLSSIKTPAYSTIVSLDKQFRAAPLPDSLSRASNPCVNVNPSSYQDYASRLQEHEIYLFNNYMLSMLHHVFFSRALIESAEDIFKSPYLRSVMTVHDGSKSIIRQLVWLSQNEAEALKILTCWRMCLLRGLISLASLLVKASKSSLAIDCFSDFEVGCELLLLSPSTPQPVQKIISRLYRSALTAMQEAHGNQIVPSARLVSLTREVPDPIVPPSLPPFSTSSALSTPSTDGRPHSAQSSHSHPEIAAHTFVVPSQAGHRMSRSVGVPPALQTGCDDGHWNFNDYVRMHSNGETLFVRTENDAMTTPLSYHTPHPTPYEGVDFNHLFAYSTPQTTSPMSAGTPAGPHNINEMDNPTWEQLMIRIGL
ncbi:hypothetical protein CPB86DRAFT_699318 [Serendipita vermifera]|nr:hypothetical protein CPB86DRAFT_699318 [Serendipita vermifera]